MELSDRVSASISGTLSDNVPDSREVKVDMVPSPIKTSMSWTEFSKHTGVDIPQQCQKKDKLAGDEMVRLAVEKGFTDWKFSANKSKFVQN